MNTLKKLFAYAVLLCGMALVNAACSKDSGKSYSASDIAGSWKLVDGYTVYHYGESAGKYSFAENGPEFDWVRLNLMLFINGDGTGQSPTDYGHFSYTLKGSNLICVFEGDDYSETFTIKELTEDKLVLYYKDVEDGWFDEEYDFQRVTVF